MPRLDILLARNLDLSRRQVARLLRAGRVHDADGRRLDDPREPWAPATLPRTVRVDDEPVSLFHRHGVLLHKPLGCVTALRDARHPTAYDLLGGVPLRRELRAVGRLDKDTAGLLLWTTDGTLLHRLTHPRWAVPRRYDVALRRPFADPPPDLVLDDGHRPELVELARRDRASLHPALPAPPEATVFATIVLTSGRFHEVRRIFAALGSEVVGLCRVAFGPIELPIDLGPGEHRPVDLHRAFHGLSPRS